MVTIKKLDDSQNYDSNYYFSFAFSLRLVGNQRGNRSFEINNIINKKIKCQKDEEKERWGDDEGNDDDDADDRYMTVKCGLTGILRPHIRDILFQNIADKSIISTRICALASLLFLYKWS